MSWSHGWGGVGTWGWKVTSRVGGMLVTVAGARTRGVLVLVLVEVALLVVEQAVVVWWPLSLP